MFGYVNICKDELKIKDYNLFRAYYCGLCEALGRKGSLISRLGLSYDMTFLAIVLSSVSENETSLCMKRCAVHPTRKRARVINNAAVNYAAYMSVIMMYLKFLDDWHDDKSIPALAGMALYTRAVKKAKKEYPFVYSEARKHLGRLGTLEKEKCADIDMAADCFAKILEILFVPDFVSDTAVRRALSWMGYNTGRWVYIIDAVNDVEKDLKSKSYNPVLYAYPPKSSDMETYKKFICEKLSLILTYTLDNIASAYELLNIKRNNDILDNIIYLGLKGKQALVLKEEPNEPV